MPVPNGWDYIEGSTDEYTATLTNQSYENAFGIKGSGTLVVTTNRNTGNYIVYEKQVTGNKAIYQSIKGSNAPKIENEKLYEAYFLKNDGPANQRNLDKTVKQRTLDIAEATLLVGRDRDQNVAALEALKADSRYKSLGDNTDPVPPAQPPANQGGTQPPNSNGQSDPNQQTGIKDPPITSAPLNQDNFKGRPVSNIAGGDDLRYPESMPTEGYDFIKITSHKYAPAGLDIRGNDIEERISEETISRIHLPMLPGMSESNSISWGGDKVNPLQLVAGKLAEGAIRGIGDFDFGAIAAAVGSTAADINSLTDDPLTKQALIAYFAGQAVGANIFTRTTGSIINPNLELLFNSPTLRTFNFNFKLTPRSEKEAKVIRKIIKSFKQNSLPQRSQSNLFLLTPNVFRLKYIQGDTGEQHPFMNEIKPCALTSFNVNYAPEGSYMTFRGSLPSMTCYEMKMQFSEIQPIYADEIDNQETSMGY